MRAESKALLQLPAALGAYRQGPGPKRALPGLPVFLKNSAAPVAFQENLTPLDRDQRDKKEAQIMIHAFEPGRGQAAIGADPCLIIDPNLFGLYATHKNEGPPPALCWVFSHNLSFLRPASKKKAIRSAGPMENLPKTVDSQWGIVDYEMGQLEEK